MVCEDAGQDADTNQGVPQPHPTNQGDNKRSPLEIILSEIFVNNNILVTERDLVRVSEREREGCYLRALDSEGEEVPA